MSEPHARNEVAVVTGIAADPGARPRTERLRSLDVFRGLTVALMIVVNNPGSWSRGFPILRHAPWNGLTLADLVFPWFLLSVGISIPISLRRELERGHRRGEIVRRAIRRAAVLFSIGLGLHVMVQQQLVTLRIPGVLQRIAVCYLASAIIFLWLDLRRIILLTAALLTGYWLILSVVPVAGFGAGVLTPEGSVVGVVDRAILGRHIWTETRFFDPEGILSTLPAMASTLLGVIVGEWLRRARTWRRMASVLVTAGAVAIFVGLAWGIVLPVNKSLWTSSYALVASGCGVVVFGLLAWTLDRRAAKFGFAPIEAFGVNALPMFVFSGVASRLLAMVHVVDANGRVRDAKTFLYLTWVAPGFPPPIASLAWSLLVLGFWLAVAWALRVRRIVISA